ncbi:TPA: hypothetical protein ACXIHT_005735 [Pseudomonas aeruginosa]
MNNKPTLNHHHQTALLYLYNNPNQPPFTGPNNKALNELRQMGYVKAQEFENWAGTGRIRAEWMLTKAGIDFVENEILRKCAACTGIGQTLLRGKCTICNGSGQVWISDEPQRHFEDCPQCAPKFEKTDANRLAEVIETSIRLEKELEESEKRWSEPEASQAENAENAEQKRLSEAYEWGYEDGQNNPSGYSSKEERDACVNELLKRPDLAKAEAERPAVVGYRSVESGMVYEQDYGLKDPEALTTVAECDSIVGELRAQRDAALARVAELEGKLTDWVHEGFRLNEALAAAQTAHECTMGVGDGDGKLLVHGDHASIKAAQKIVIERDAALARIAELESKLAETQPYKQHPQIIGCARKKELAPLLDPSQPDGSYIYIGLDHPACWAEEPPYEFLTPLYTGPVTRHSAPEGYALVPVRETEAMHDAVMALLYNGVARTDTQKLLDAYINAATNKESV